MSLFFAKFIHVRLERFISLIEARHGHPGFASVSQVSHAGLREIDTHWAYEINDNGLLRQSLVLLDIDGKVLNERLPFAELQVEVIAGHLMELHHLEARIVRLLNVLFDVESCHFKFHHWRECSVGIIDKQE